MVDKSDPAKGSKPRAQSTAQAKAKTAAKARQQPTAKDTAAVPGNRVSRFSRMVRLASGVAGGMLAEGSRQLVQGKRPKASQLLLTPANARRVADQLANLRGAAMKVGQLLSMDAGDVLPPQFTEILSRLRADAQAMPVKQVVAVLEANWGVDWEEKVYHFSFDPVASASIGQVHEAMSQKGKRLAIKLQYPGVRKSIDSDVDNVATLLRISRLLPAQLDIAPLLAEAKVQLHEEADYLREASYLKRYRELLADSPQFVLPEVDDELTTENILAMGFVEGQAIESLEGSARTARDRAMSLLLELLFRELFEFQMVQTDPNFANYQYCYESKRLVLLDFGATRNYSDKIVAAYKGLFNAAIAQDRDALFDSARRIGYFQKDIAPDQRESLLDLFIMATEPARHVGVYDFAASDLVQRLSEAGMDLSVAKGYWHTPPADALFLHRKLGGMFMLATRLQARVDVRELLQVHL
jgi:predicted unusual protein kinase regulating ubiquinone biosynthesis (AarF/ABC1/UbiB family)